MQLYQFLRHFSSGFWIVLFDLNGNQLLQVRTKEDIHTDYYEYDVMEISLGKVVMHNMMESALYITLVK